jgi:class 3 adenylate cyclase/DNA-binding transcriptional MerR regulator
LLTSKDIIERTGISRATLNNYIASGLVPRPQVLPPGPEDGAAPRIGYFPDDTVERVETIQRLKREGWSITRIAEHFAAQAAGAASPALRATAPAPAPAADLARATAPAAIDADHPLSLGNGRYPAYLVSDGFRLLWANDAARASSLSPLAHRAGAVGSNVFGHLLDLPDPAIRDAVLRFHLEVAKDRAHSTSEMFRDLPSAQVAQLQGLYQQARRPDAGMVTQVGIAASGAHPARQVYAVHFREAVLFAYAPGQAAGEGRPATPVAAASAPVSTPVAVLVATLQDASDLWVKLSAQEYFELLNEMWTTLDQVLRRHGGRSGRQPGEVLVWYFLPQQGANHRWNALAAAHEVRDAMRQISLRWQARKGWDVELCMNAGVDEGQEWMGAVGAADQGRLQVLGEAADRAEQLSRCSRAGAILVTRGLLGKLPREDRQRLAYGVPRFAGGSNESPVLFTFARLAQVAAPNPVPPRVADLAVCELVDLQDPLSGDLARATQAE